jgi:hypothetical protein
MSDLLKCLKGVLYPVMLALIVIWLLGYGQVYWDVMLVCAYTYMVFTLTEIIARLEELNDSLSHAMKIIVTYSVVKEESQEGE